MKSIIQLGLLVALLMIGRTGHAQTYPCSNPGPGEVVVGQTQGGNGAAPMQLCQKTGTQGPQAQWETRWGAIATDASHGIIGSAANQRTKMAAQEVALTDCQNSGGSSCILQGAFYNGCGTLISGDKGFNVSWGDDEASATQKGMDVCKTNDTGCHVFFKTCSPAVRAH